tara:strand:- start:631 stop:825 length:195 start_codon:yes stop_codon:yes gene_type:complete
VQFLGHLHLALALHPANAEPRNVSRQALTTLAQRPLSSAGQARSMCMRSAPAPFCLAQPVVDFA